MINIAIVFDVTRFSKKTPKCLHANGKYSIVAVIGENWQS